MEKRDFASIPARAWLSQVFNAKSGRQVAAIRSAFTPTQAEIARARKVVELYRADPAKPLLFEGKLIELPSIKRLERVAAYEA